MEEQYNNINVGKIYSFDGEAGVIVTSNRDYHFDKKDFLYDNPKEGDMVKFVSNTVRFGDEKEYVALYINKLDKNYTLRKDNKKN